MRAIGHTAKGLTALPTWALVQAFRPFLPKDHPWKYKFFTLPDWEAGRTSFTVMNDAIYWFSVALIFIYIVL